MPVAPFSFALIQRAEYGPTLKFEIIGKRIPLDEKNGRRAREGHA
jgi:hypothetical protein